MCKVVVQSGYMVCAKRLYGKLKWNALQARTSHQKKTVSICHIKHLLFLYIEKHSWMPKRKCVKSYRPLQHRNSVTRFKQVENQSRNHALRKRMHACMGNGNTFVLYQYTRHPTTSYTGLMLLFSVSATKPKDVIHNRDTSWLDTFHCNSDT